MQLYLKLIYHVTLFRHGLSFSISIEPPHDKTNNVDVRPAKTQISLGNRPVWSVFTVRSVGS